MRTQKKSCEVGVVWKTIEYISTGYLNEETALPFPSLIDITLWVSSIDTRPEGCLLANELNA